MLLIELIVFFSLTLLYAFIHRQERAESSVVLAAVVMAIYLVIYLLVPPKPEVTHMRIGQLLGYVPMVSFGVILFPQLNTRSSVEITRFLGWFGLVVVFSILCILKLRLVGLIRSGLSTNAVCSDW